MNPNLVSSAGQRFRFTGRPRCGCLTNPEFGDSLRTALVSIVTDIAISLAYKPRLDSMFPAGNRAISQQHVPLRHAALGKLPGKGAIGRWRLAEEQEAGSVSIKAVDNGQVSPTRFTVL